MWRAFLPTFLWTRPSICCWIVSTGTRTLHGWISLKTLCGDFSRYVPKRLLSVTNETICGNRLMALQWVHLLESSANTHMGFAEHRVFQWIPQPTTYHRYTNDNFIVTMMREALDLLWQTFETVQCSGSPVSYHRTHYLFWMWKWHKIRINSLLQCTASLPTLISVWTEIVSALKSLSPLWFTHMLGMPLHIAPHGMMCIRNWTLWPNNW